MADIIKAYKIAKERLPNLNLLIGGRPDYTMQDTYEHWISKYKDIKFLGYIAEEEIPIYYTMADVFVTYSYASEGFGLTPIEAIACGTPVVCSSNLAYKEVLQDNALFVRAKRPDLLAKAIVKLLEEESQVAMMVKKAQGFIKKYSWEHVGEKLEKVYLQFLNSR